MAQTKDNYKLEEPEELFEFQDISHSTLPTQYINGLVYNTHKAPSGLSAKSLSWKDVKKKEKKKDKEKDEERGKGGEEGEGEGAREGESGF